MTDSNVTQRTSISIISSFKITKIPKSEVLLDDLVMIRPTMVRPSLFCTFSLYECFEAKAH